MSTKFISVGISALNEELNIIPTIKAVESAFDKLKNSNFEYEIIVVDDGSVDATNQLVTRYALENNKIKLVKHIKNIGLGGAIKTIIQHSNGDYVTFLPGDNDINFSLFLKMLSIIGSADVIMAYFDNEEIRGLKGYALSTVYNLIYCLTFGYCIRYINGPAIYKLSDVRKIILKCNKFSIIPELNTKLLTSGVTFTEVVGSRTNGNNGRKSMSPKNFIDVAIQYLKLCWTLKVSTKKKLVTPVRLISNKILITDE